MIQYPRILIINSESIYKRNATGITLRSLFHDWPSDKVVELYMWNPGEIEKENLSIKSNIIPPRTLPINFLIRKVTKSSISEESSGNSFGQKEEGKKPGLKYSIKQYVKYFSSTRLVNTKHIERMLKSIEFIPDVIYTLGGDFGVMKITVKLANKYKCPICMHYMDNWREILFVETSSWLQLNKKINRLADVIEAKSCKSITISPMMKDVYEARGFVKFEALMNSVPISEHKFDKIDDSTIWFIYAGGLHLDRHLALLQVEEAIKEIKANNVKLKIYTGSKSREAYEELFDRKFTIFEDFLPHNEIWKAYRNADVLVHIESFSEERIAYTKYSLSTKIPEYMMSGKPILCYAPEEIAVYKYVQNSKSGLSAGNMNDLCKCVKSLSEDSVLREQLGKNGERFACEFHSQAECRERFRKILEENAEQNI